MCYPTFKTGNVKCRTLYCTCTRPAARPRCSTRTESATPQWSPITAAGATVFYRVSNSVTVLCNCVVCVRPGRPTTHDPGAPDQILQLRRGLHPKGPQPAARHSSPSIQHHHDRLWEFRHSCTVRHCHLVTVLNAALVPVDAAL